MKWLYLELYQSELYQDIAMCGYPSGRLSLILYRNEGGVGMHLNPIIQLGHITGLMPYDESHMGNSNRYRRRWGF